MGNVQSHIAAQQISHKMSKERVRYRQHLRQKVKDAFQESRLVVEINSNLLAIFPVEVSFAKKRNNMTTN